MKVSLKWLYDYVNLSLPTQELAEKLTMAGSEVAEIVVIGDNWDGISVGQVTALEKHPDADRLLLATIDLGEESKTVVIGAPNLEEGQKVPFARVGAQLIDGHTGELVKLKPAKIRGIRSEGMACSEKELGISDRHEGIMILPPEAPVGMPLSQYMGDTILDLSITPNRPDCLSVIGIAREAAALTSQATHIRGLSLG
jgi:phenylalanyl-tRNA synthetase beta chain